MHCCCYCYSHRLLFVCLFVVFKFSVETTKAWFQRHELDIYRWLLRVHSWNANKWANWDSVRARVHVYSYKLSQKNARIERASQMKNYCQLLEMVCLYPLHTYFLFRHIRIHCCWFFISALKIVKAQNLIYWIHGLCFIF